MLTTKQKKFLKSQAVTLEPVVQIGKNGLDDPVIDSVRKVLMKRELIKIRMHTNSPDELDDVMADLARMLGAETIQVIGHTGVLFKQKKKDSAYELPR